MNPLLNRSVNGPLSSSQLEAFSAVCRAGGFTEAARLIHVTQSALSQRILNLEESLGSTLFLRERSGVRMTEAAERLLRYCQAKDALEAETLQEIGSAPGGGEIRIGGFSSIFRSALLPALDPLLRGQPGLGLKLLSRELRELPALLRSGEIDFAILGSSLEDAALERLTLGEEHSVLVERRTGPTADAYLDHDEADRTTADYLRMVGGPSTPVRRLYLDDLDSILAGAELGWGRAVVPLHHLSKHPQLRIVRPERVLRTPVILHWYRRAYSTRLHDAVISALKTGFAARISACEPNHSKSRARSPNRRGKPRAT